MNSFDSLIRRVRDEHDCSDGASSAELSSAEARLGYTLPEDLKRLLRAANGIRFWTDGDYPCRLLSAAELQSARALLRSDDGPPGIIALVEVQGDFAGIDLEPRSKAFSRLIDCSHETFPYELFGFCDSVEQAIGLIVNSDDQEWLWPAVLAYDVDFAEFS